MKKPILALIMLCILCFFFSSVVHADTITACVSSKNGAMTLLTGSDCPKGSYSISWNQTALVHGRVDATGSIMNGGGFHVNHMSNSGIYSIIFDAPFSTTPDCVAQNGGADTFYKCEMYAVNPSTATVSCTGTSIVYDSETFGYDIAYYGLLQDMPFSLICVD